MIFMHQAARGLRKLMTDTLGSGQKEVSAEAERFGQTRASWASCTHKGQAQLVRKRWPGKFAGRQSLAPLICSPARRTTGGAQNLLRACLLHFAQ